VVSSRFEKRKAAKNRARYQRLATIEPGTVREAAEVVKVSVKGKMLES
jgi:hypothetical protein